MAFYTVESLASDMLAMLTGVIAVVLRSAAIMTGSTLSVDVNGSGGPVRRGLPAMTPVAGTGVVRRTVCCTAALGIKVGRDINIRRATIMRSSIMAGITAWGY